ncbi:MAG: hypothetical protein R3C49_19055 [Planctomycetaceae bacterium]
MKRYISVCMVLVCIINPSLLFAADSVADRENLPQRPAPVPNVEMNADGLLDIRIVNQLGEPVPGIAVHLVSAPSDSPLTTDSLGRFRIQQDRGGLVVFRIGSDAYAFRAWSRGTAPPGATASIAFVCDHSPVVRGARRRAATCDGYCQPDQCSRKTERCYGVALLALGGTAAYMALSRDNASD